VANGTIWGLTWVLERLWKLRHLATKIVIYDRVDLIHTGRRDELIADLSRRTGVVIEKIEIGKVDLLRDTAVIKVFFDANVVPGHFETPGETE
jgi:O-succinylbenzoate synthase